MTKHTEELFKKVLNDPDNYDSVITHLEQDILQCKVEWALGSITVNKAGGGDGIPAELFKIIKDDIVTVLHSICQQIWETQQWPQDWKKSVFSFKSQRSAVQRMFRLPMHSLHMLVRLYPSRQASAVCELRISRCTSWIQKKQRNQRSNCK